MNYVTPVSVYGMLPANAEFVNGYNNVIFKNKQHKQIISWNSKFISQDIPVSYYYISQQPSKDAFRDIKKAQMMINGVFDQEFFKFRGESGRHYREYLNRYNKVFTMSKECQTSAVLDLIRRWEKFHGHDRYRMQMHSSYDKRFFKKSLEQLKVDVNIWFFMKDDICVGYKVMEKTPLKRHDGLLEYRSLLRKYDPQYSHICLYVDTMSYKTLFDEINQPFVVNVGSSSKGVAAYEHEKFPVYALEDIYFYKNKVNKKD